jgi:hypothetical protein
VGLVANTPGGQPVLEYIGINSEKDVKLKAMEQYKVKDFDVGAHAFVSMKYAEFQIGILQQIGTVTDTKQTVKSRFSGSSYGKKAVESVADSMTASQGNKSYLSTLLLFDLKGKYPFQIGKKFSLAPEAGVRFRVPVAGNDYSDIKHNANWGFGLVEGVGCDYMLTKKLFLRGELTCYEELAADKDINIPEVSEKKGGYKILNDDSFKVANKGYYIQPQLQISAGYRFGK